MANQKEELLRVASDVIAGRREPIAMDEHGLTLGAPISGDAAKLMLLAEMAQLDEYARFLAEQVSAAESLWQRLIVQGIKEGSTGRYDAIFEAAALQDAEALRAEYGDDGWSAAVKGAGNDGCSRVVVTSRPVVLGLEVVQALVKMMVESGQEFSCRFVGLQFCSPRRWWKIW